MGCVVHSCSFVRVRVRTFVCARTPSRARARACAHEQHCVRTMTTTYACALLRECACTLRVRACMRAFTCVHLVRVCSVHTCACVRVRVRACVCVRARACACVCVRARAAPLA
eukprot:6182881-Pleurochrysis_carterae.AAC.1